MAPLGKVRPFIVFRRVATKKARNFESVSTLSTQALHCVRFRFLPNHATRPGKTRHGVNGEESPVGGKQKIPGIEQPRPCLQP